MFEHHSWNWVEHSAQIMLSLKKTPQSQYRLYACTCTCIIFSACDNRTTGMVNLGVACSCHFIKKTPRYGFYQIKFDPFCLHWICSPSSRGSNSRGEQPQCRKNGSNLIQVSTKVQINIDIGRQNTKITDSSCSVP